MLKEFAFFDASSGLQSNFELIMRLDLYVFNCNSLFIVVFHHIFFNSN